MTIRNPIPNGTGLSIRTALNLRTKALFNAAQLPLTSIGGTANAVTATLAPVLDGDGLLDGMTFTLTWGAANTGGVTLAINGGSPVPVLGPDGIALPAGSVGDGLRSQITYIGGDFVMLSPTLLLGGAGGSRYSFTFTTSGTWTKPAALPDDTPVTIQIWAGGGGGHATTVGGGGGGGFATRIVRASDLGATVSVTVGAGGVAGAAGGNSSFGAFLTAYGGAAGLDTSGGGGGGEIAAGSGLAGGAIGGGSGGAPENVGIPAATLFGGGGGSGGASAAGGAAVYGGGGGGSTGGVSAYGGNGGAAAAGAGTAPSGGGAIGSSGARGECRVWI